MNGDLLFLLLMIALGGVAGFVFHHLLATYKGKTVEEKVKKQIEGAKSQAGELTIKAKERAVEIIEEAQKEIKERKEQVARQEERLVKREDQLDTNLAEVNKRQEEIKGDLEKLKIAKQQIDDLRGELAGKLEEVAGLSKEEAGKKLMEEVEAQEKENLAIALARLQRERAEELEKKGTEIITTSIQRYARSHVSEVTTSVYVLPDEDLKGKIIGREGRNIRTIERLTGVELIVDEAPDAVTISSFDPLRREIARVALDKLIKDGRIQPVKIEEKVQEATSEINKRMEEKGEEAVLEVGIYDFPKEIIQILGRLHFRTSYGQNVLTHSIEVAHMAKMIATELGINVEVAKRAALVHDIGKAIDHEVEGTHVDIGRKILKKYGVDEHIIRAMESHHDEYPYSVPEAYVVTAADAISASRPGSRRESIENYLKRLEELEKVATKFKGIKNAYAISAGRELRVFVVPEQIDDFGALQLARDVARAIESELKYPGEIKVTIVREMRAVEYAK